jgi:hypothetical protein
MNDNEDATEQYNRINWQRTLRKNLISEYT